ncbi:MAG: succinate dehydrogenase cytochrome b subunit [Bdellovibrionales bacterium]
MIPLKRSLSSSVGKKFVMGLSGIALVFFAITHLAGNLTLLDPSGKAFNLYAKSLHDFGYLAIAGEFALLGLFLVHIVYAVLVTRDNKAARKEAYASSTPSKGGHSKSSVGSRNMIITGVLLLAFLILHVKQFRFGPSIDMGYTTDVNGESARDLYRLVAETFSDPLNVGIYVIAMAFLWFHLRHGFWSAYQSLGVLYPRISGPIYCFAWVMATLLAVGFLLLPIYLYVLQQGGNS